MIWTIANREMKNLFLSPLAWILLGITQVIYGKFFITFLNDNFADRPSHVAWLEGRSRRQIRPLSMKIMVPP